MLAVRKNSKPQSFSRKFLVSLIATSAVAMSADLPETLNPQSVVSRGVALISDAEINQLIEQSTETKETKQPRSMAVKKYTVQKGDSLGRIWAKFGGTIDRAKAALSELRSIGGSADVLKVGDSLSLLVSHGSGEIRGFRRRLDDGRVILLRDKNGAEIDSSVTVPAISESERTVSGTIYSSFSKAAREQKIPYEIIDDLVDLFGNRIDFRKDLKVGDTFSIIYQEQKNDRGTLIKTGSIIAASIENEGKLIAAVRHQPTTGEARYYNETGSVLGEFFLRYPVQFTRISSVFTTKRLHPILGKHRPHNGVDFSAPTGTPVRSIAQGIITDMGFDRGRGNYVKVQHDAKYTTEYFHLAKFSPGLRKGAKIGKGSILGGVGATGLATAPHLHFGFFENGIYKDPLKAKLPTEPIGGEKIPHGYLVAKLDALKGQHQQVRLAMTTKKSSAG
jgi:murein DD-endopeptidase MepM/ murein hydrolase activator NlpD